MIMELQSDRQRLLIVVEAGAGRAGEVPPTPTECGRPSGRTVATKNVRSASGASLARMSRGRLHGSSAEPYRSRLRVEIGSVMVSVVPRVDGTCQPTDFATHTGVADLDALFAILEPWSVLRPWDFAWAF